MVCRLGSLPATVQLAGSATTTGVKQFTATVDARQVDPAPGNDIDRHLTPDGRHRAREAPTVPVVPRRQPLATLGSRPTSDTTAPHTFTLGGTLARTDRRALACSGPVTLTVRNGTRVVTTRRATLRRSGEPPPAATARCSPCAPPRPAPSR